MQTQVENETVQKIKFLILCPEKTVIATAERVEFVGAKNIKIYNVKTIHPNTRMIDWVNMREFFVIADGVRVACYCSAITDDLSASFISCVWAHIVDGRQRDDV